jgi:HlyD family secretion protein
LRLELAEAEGRERRLRLAAAVPPELVAALEADEVSLDLRLASLEVAHLSAKLALDERRAKAEIAALVEARQRAFGRVAELEAAIARMTVVAPRSGTVVYATDEDRDKVKLGDSVWAGRAVLSIPDLARMVGAGKVDEADAGRLAPGQAVRFFLDAYPGSELHCRVGEVGTSVSARTPGSPVKEVSVRIDLEETDPRRMRPGMRWRGSIETELLAQVLTIPADAVTRTGSGPRVVRRRGLVVERVEPRLGRFWAGRVVVLSGLAEGDRVLRGGEGGRR